MQRVRASRSLHSLRTHYSRAAALDKALECLVYRSTPNPHLSLPTPRQALDMFSCLWSTTLLMLDGCSLSHSHRLVSFQRNWQYTACAANQMEETGKRRWCYLKCAEWAISRLFIFDKEKQLTSSEEANTSHYRPLTALARHHTKGGITLGWMKRSNKCEPQL